MTYGTARYHETCHHKHYSLTCAQMDELFVRAGGACQICGMTGPMTKRGMLFIDHDVAGVRGLLCNRCNTLLGLPPWADLDDPSRRLNPWWRRRMRSHLPGDAVRAYLASPWHARDGVYKIEHRDRS